MNKHSLSIKMVTKLSGVGEHTLRAWEKRYNAITPKRADSGHRFYSLDDVEKLKLLNKLTQAGYSISGIANLNVKELEKLEKEIQVENKSIIPNRELTQITAPDYLDKNIIHKKIFKIIDQLDFETFQTQMIFLRNSLPVLTYILDVASPVMGHIGMSVVDEKITIADEHMFSAIMRDILGQMLQTLSLSVNKKDSFVFTTREGDIHEFGILMAAILTSSLGYKVHYLGPNMPADDLAQMAMKFKPNAIVIGYLDLPKSYVKISMDDFIQSLNKATDKKFPLIIGGNYKSTKKISNLSIVTNLSDFYNQLT